MSRDECLTKILETFDEERELYEAFTTNLNNLTRLLLDQENAEYFSISPRTKDCDSLERKLVREDKAGKYKSLTDITDLTGVRVVCLLQHQVDKVCAIIEKSFEIDRENSVDKTDQLEPDKFGYLSKHFVISLKPNRLKLPEFKRFKGLKAEFQIRTLLQHTWADIDWTFRYKNESEAPKALRRRLFRISALLEAADNEFSSVSDEIKKLREEYNKGIGRGELNIPINTESVLSYIKSSSDAQELLEMARQSGLTVLPISNDINSSIKLLVETLDYLCLDTLKSVDDMLRQKKIWAKEFIPAMVKASATTREKPPQLQAPAVLRYLIFASSTEQQRRVIREKYPLSTGYATLIEGILHAQNGRRRPRSS